MVIGEVLAIYPFRIIRSRLGPKTVDTNNDGTPDMMAPVMRNIAVGKGILERGVMLLGLVNGFVDILAVYGALKIATRLRDDSDCPITNDYFLVGNLASVGIAMSMAALYQNGVARQWISLFLDQLCAAV